MSNARTPGPTPRGADVKRRSAMMGTVNDPAQARRFFDQVLALPWVQGPDGRRVFTRCPGGAGVHPAPSRGRTNSDRRLPALRLSCDVLSETIAELVCDGASITAAHPTTTIGHAPAIAMWVPRYHGTVVLQPHRALSSTASGAPTT